MNTHVHLPTIESKHQKSSLLADSRHLLLNPSANLKFNLYGKYGRKFIAENNIAGPLASLTNSPKNRKPVMSRRRSKDEQDESQTLSKIDSYKDLIVVPSEMSFVKGPGRKELLHKHHYTESSVKKLTVPGSQTQESTLNPNFQFAS